MIALENYDIEKTDPPTIIDERGNKFWKNNEGKLHREGDLPAVIHTNGYKAYCKNGGLHRLEGPARVWGNGKEEYWIEANFLFKDRWEQEIQKIKKLESKNELSFLLKLVGASCILNLLKQSKSTNKLPDKKINNKKMLVDEQSNLKHF